MIVRATLIFGVLIVLLVAAGLGGFFWLRTSLPKINGSVTLKGLNEPVEVVRDAHAVPHIFAESEEDAYFALGFVHAQDRLWQMEFMRRLGRGRLAEVLGEAALDTDRFIRTLRLRDHAEAILENTDARVRRALEAYADGVNAWLNTPTGALPPEFVLLGFEPERWHPVDSLLWNRLMALRLGRNWKTELLRARMDRELRARDLPNQLLLDLWPDDPKGSPATLADASADDRLFFAAPWDSLGIGLAEDSGSNAWVVHGQLTESGKPVLANDPHLLFAAPVLWYLMRIEAPGLTVTGVTVPGVPFTIIGHNGRIAWGMTNAGGDVQDLFVETLDPGNPEVYLSPDGPLVFDVWEEVIQVEGAPSVALTVRESRHGPVISDVLETATGVVDPTQVLALATPALRGDDRSVEALYAINRATDWADFLAAAANSHTPHVNLLFADTEGDIGFVSPGRIPVRENGDGRFLVPGADGRHDWHGFIPKEDLPRSHNPPSGRVINANNRIVDDGYPYLITTDWGLPYRAERIVEVLESEATHSVSDSHELQLDTLSGPARQLLPLMLRVEPIDARGRQAVKLLSNWDMMMRRERPEPLIYTAWLRNLVHALARDEIGAELVDQYLWLVIGRAPLFVEAALTHDQHWCDAVGTPGKETCEGQLAQSLDLALDELSALLGENMNAWQWGELHQASFRHRVLTKVPIARWWADLSIEADGGDHTVNRGMTAREQADNPYRHDDGSGLRAVYDLSDLDNSRFMIATGQSGIPLSPHYRDFLETWRDGGFIHIAGQRSELEETAIGVLSLRPANP
jgi:penicillin amidase